MARVILLMILIPLLARTFWRVIDGLIEGMSGRGAPNATARSTSLVRDPVCGTFVLPDHALTLVDGRARVFFCSDACRAKYQARTA